MYMAENTILTSADAQFLRAARRGHVETMHEKLEKGADKNATDRGNTALHYCAENEHMDALQYLCETVKPDFNAQDKNGETPLMRALMKNGTAAAYLIARPEVDITIRNHHGHGIVHRAAYNHDIFSRSVMRLVLAHAQELDEVDNEGYTPVHTAVNTENMQGLEALLLAGADPLLTGGESIPTPMEVALKGGDVLMSGTLRPFTQLPRKEDIGDMTYAALVEKDANGKRLLDNPYMWRQMDAILDVLEAKGEPFPSIDDMEQGGVLEQSPLCLAIHTRQYAAVERCLAHHGKRLPAETFLEADGKSLSRFGQAALDAGILQQEFTLEKASLRTPGETGVFFRSLPQHVQTALPNYWRLSMELERTASAGKGR